MRDLRRLLALYRPYRSRMVAGILLSSVSALSNLSLMAVSGWFIASMALAGLGRLGPFSFFAPAALIRGLAILRAISRYLERLVTHEATLRLLAALRTWFYGRLEPLAPAVLGRYRRGDLLSRIRADVDSLDRFYLAVLVPTAAAALSGAILFAFLLSISVPIAATTGLGLVLAGVFVPFLAGRLAQRPSRRIVQTRSDLRAAVADSVRGMGELQVYAASGRQIALIDRLGATLGACQIRLARVQGLSIALATLASGTCVVAATVLATSLVRSSRMAPADLPMIALLVLAAFDLVAMLPDAYRSLGESGKAARRIFEIADIPAPIEEPCRPARLPDRFDIAVERLTLRYGGAHAPAIDDLSFRVGEGEVLALVGPSGAGKTSILNALLRFHEYQAGTIRLGGTDLRQLDGEDVRRLFAVVAQETHLFNATIRDNLRLARPGASDGVLHKALRDAAFGEDLMAFPHGLDTMVGEAGARLSGGQGRRIAIARAFLKDAPILLLDEPTEGLDSVSEQRVIEALARLMAGRTTLVTTHRDQVLRLAGARLHMCAGRGVQVSP